MKMSREKMLLLGLVGTIVLWQGQSLFQVMFVEPVAKREAKRTALAQSVADKELQKTKLAQATERLKVLSGRSLPPDAGIAEGRYQIWLREQAEKAKLTAISVENVKSGRGSQPALVSGPASRGSGPRGGSNAPAYTAILATVKAKGTVEQVTDFLHGFHQSGLLHRVQKVTLTSLKHEGNPVMDVDIQVEALALKDSPERPTLLADPNAPPKPDKPLKDRLEYAALSARSLFLRTYNGPPKPPVNKPKTIVDELPDTAAFVHLTASVGVNGAPDATLYDRTSNQYTKLKPGGDFSVAGLAGKVVRIAKDFVVLEIKGEQLRLDLGKNLREMVPAADGA